MARYRNLFFEAAMESPPPRKSIHRRRSRRGKRIDFLQVCSYILFVFFCLYLVYDYSTQEIPPQRPSHESLEDHEHQEVGGGVFYKIWRPLEVKYDTWVMLLHGSKHTHLDWIDIGTPKKLQDAGCNVIAFDLPGYGRSSHIDLDHNEKRIYLDKVLNELKISRVVLISPSMSGTFAVTMALHSPKVVGWIPIAPVRVNERDIPKYKSFYTPTLIVYGERDVSLGFKTRDILSAIPTSTQHMVPDAGHACHLDDPVDFHQAMFKFLEQYKYAQYKF